MTDYTKTTDFAAKDSLPSGDSNKVIRGTEFDTEFNNIATASATKADLSNPNFQGDVSVAGNISVSGTVDGRDVAADGTKLDTVETNADVTDTANVTAAGAVMDSELTNEAAVKALDQGVATTDSPTFAGLTVNNVIYTGTDGTDGQVLTTDGAGNATFEALPDSLYLNVKDFGATGDGSTDDTTAIQNAINHASNNNIQTIFFPDGHYKYTTLRFYHDATDNPNFQETPNRDGRFQLRGTGRLAIADLKNVGKSPNRIYGSILESTSTGNGLIVEPTGTFQTTTDARNFVVKDLTLVADNTGYIVTAESCPGLTFDHCSFKQLNHQGSGILARNCWFFTMNQCYVFGQSWINEAFATAGQTEFSYTFDNPTSTSDIIVQKKGGLVSSSDYSINTTTKVVTLNTGADLNDKVTISRKNTGDGISSQFVGSAFGSFAGLWNITDSLVDSWANGVHWTGGQVTNLSLRNTAVQNCNNYNIYADAGVIQQMLLDNVYMENQSVQGVSFIKSDGSGTSSAAIRNLRMINCFILAGGTFPRVTGTCIDIDSIDVIDIEGMYVYRMRQPFLNISATKNSQNVPGEIKNSIFATDQDLSAEPTIYLLSGKIPNVHNCVWPGFNDGFYDTTNDILLFDPSVDSNFPRQFTDIKGTTGTAKFGFGDTKHVTIQDSNPSAPNYFTGPYNITGANSRTYYEFTHSNAGGLKVILPDTGEVNDGRLIIIKNNEASTSTSQFPYINVVNNSDQNTTIGRLSPGQAGLFILDQQNSTEFKYVGRTFTDDLELTDDHKITFGRGTSAGPDMEIYHDSTSGESRIDTLAGLTLDGLTYPTADGSANQVLTTDGSGTLSFANVSGIGINAVVDDTTPQLGGDLDLNSHDITGTGNLDFTGTINTVLSVDGTTEDVFITGATPALEFVESDNGGSRMRMAWNNATMFQTLYGATTTTFGSFNLQTRASDGTNNQVVYVYDGGANDRHWWGTRAAGDVAMQLQSDGTFNVRGGDVVFEDSSLVDKFFWDASTSRLGLGTTSPSAELDIVGDATDAQIEVGNNVGQKLTITGGSSGIDFTTANALAMTFGTSGSERLRIDNSGNVGIGTTSPSANLTVGSPDASAISFVSNGVASLGGGIAFDAGAGNDVQLFNYRTSNMQFGNGGTADMTIDSSGNVGIGETNPAEELHISATTPTIRLEDSDGTNQFLNIYESGGGANYLSSQNGSYGTHNFYGYDGTTSTSFINLTQDAINQNTSAAWYIRNRVSGGSLNLGVETTAGALYYPVVMNGTSDILAFNNAEGEMARFTSSGNFGIGTTSAPYKLVVSNGGASSIEMEPAYSGTANLVQHYNRSGAAYVDAVNIAGQHRFAIGATEAMRIDSGGNLLVGKSVASTTTAGGEINADGTLVGVRDGGNPLVLNRLTSDGTIASFRKDGTTVGSVSVTASATAYNTSSDQRLKENIVDAPSASDDIDAIQVRSFDWKADGSHQKYGMVAQELQTVAPEAVTEGETEEDMMSVDYSKLVPMLVKEIQSLRARVAQLEGAN